MNETAMQISNKPRNAREAEQAVREWREETEVYRRYIVAIYALAQPKYVVQMNADGTYGAMKRLDDGLPPELLARVAEFDSLIRDAAKRRGLDLETP